MDNNIKNNEKNYNAFLEKVEQQRLAIIDGTLNINTLDDFNNFCQEFDKLYKESDNYIECIVNEGFIFKYLEMLHDLLVQLQRFHENILEVNEQMLESEWLDIRSIIFYENLENECKNMNLYYKKNPTEKVQHELNEKISLRKKLITAANQAIKRMNDRVEYSEKLEKNLISQGVNKAPVLEWKSINESKLENLSLNEKIKTLEEAMLQIASLEGEKSPIIVNGQEILISIDYVSLYLHYNIMLDNFKAQKEKEINQLLESDKLTEFDKLGKSIEKQLEESLSLPEEYLALIAEKEKINKELARLKDRAETFGNKKNKLINVYGYGELKLRILKADFELFDDLDERLHNVNRDLEKIMEDNELKEKTVEERKDEIFDKINFLKQAGLEGEELDKHIIALINELRRIEKRKILTCSASLYHIFLDLGFTKEEANYYANITYNPEYLAKDKTIKDKKKISIFKRIKEVLLTNDFDLEDIEEFDLEEEYKIAIKTTKNRKRFPKFLNALSSRISKSIKAISIEPNVLVSKISNYRKSKINIKSEIRKKFERVTYTVGFMALLTSSALLSTKEEVKANNVQEIVEVPDLNAGVISDLANSIKETQNNSYMEYNAGVVAQMGEHLENAVIEHSEYENMADRIGEEVYKLINLDSTFTIDKNAPIYENEYDASTRENEKKPYYSSDTKRTIESIIYEYNGTKILLDKTDPDFEATKQALESNGAIPVAVKSQSEKAVGCEGFYNIEDINIEGRSR